MKIRLIEVISCKREMRLLMMFESLILINHPLTFIQGVITQSAILCPTLPINRQLCLVALKSFTDVLELLKQVKLQLSDVVGAVEFLDGASMRIVNTQLGLKNPLNKDYEFYALVEVVSSTEGSQNDERLFSFLSSTEKLVIVSLIPTGIYINLRSNLIQSFVYNWHNLLGWSSTPR